MKNNIITLTDSYKCSHHRMYPIDTEVVYSYFESRIGARFNKTIFFGLQYLLKEYLEGVVVTKDKIIDAQILCEKHFGSKDIFNFNMWKLILEKYGGKLPVRIRAVAEGTPVATSNVLMTIENTDPDCYALTNHLETLLTHVWASSTVATLSYEVSKLIDFYLTETGCDKTLWRFMLHDFGFRGVSSVESAGVEGAGHLLNFMGTDTLKAMEVAHDYYGASYDGLAYSVPASEHSVMTSYGPEDEEEIVRELLHTYPEGILSIVADSYDVYNFTAKIIGTTFKDIIQKRKGKVVVRPDSGEPTSTTLALLGILGDKFGFKNNSKGFKELPPYIGLLWGDGIDYYGIRDILHAMKDAGWASNNIVFGMGGGLLQKINRDTQRFAFKCSAQQRQGHWVDIYKKPLDVSKASKKGRLGLYTNERGELFTGPEGKTESHSGNMLQPVFEDGVILKEYTFNECRKNTKNGW